jgi:hypothetical protein
LAAKYWYARSQQGPLFMTRLALVAYTSGVVLLAACRGAEPESGPVSAPADAQVASTVATGTVAADTGGHQDSETMAPAEPSPPLTPDDPHGLEPLVNMDVWQGCTVEGEQPPATGFTFILDRLDPSSPDPAQAAVTALYPNLWVQSGPNETNEETAHSKSLSWYAPPDGSQDVAYGDVEHFGYRLAGDPSHRVTAQWLFGDGHAASRSCIPATISTSWHEASSQPIALVRRPGGKARGILVDVAQHSHRQGLAASLAYVATADEVRLDDLDRSWTELAQARSLISDVPMAYSIPVTVQLPAAETDRWLVLLGEWRLGDDRTPDAQPILTTFHAIRADTVLPARSGEVPPASN